MTLSLLPGPLLVLPDPDEVAKGEILYPDVERVHACSGTVMLHERRGLDDLTGKRIFVQKWSDRGLELRGTRFWIIREAAVLMILEE